MRFLTIILIINLFFLSGCFSSNPQIQKTAQRIYAKKSWDAPLPPEEFKSDGCSCWPDSEWLECCVEHDLAYWMGGSRDERKNADIALQECVSQLGHRIMGKTMYFGSRIGGAYWLPTPFRWGYGWNYPQSGPPGKEY